MTDVHHSAPELEQPAELFLEFVNTLEFSDGRPVDHVSDARTLARWLRSSGAAQSRVSATRLEREMPAFRQLRDLIRDVVAGLAEGSRPSPAQVESLNAVLRLGLHYDQLQRQGRASRFSMTRVGDDLGQARAAIAGSLAHYLADHDPERLRVCANDGCRWLFVDRSHAGRRRWCDMRTCGNRAKVARHRQRVRERGQAAAARAPRRASRASSGALTG